LRHNGYEFVIEDIKDILKDHQGVDHVNLFIFHPGKPDQVNSPCNLPSYRVPISKLGKSTKTATNHFLLQAVLAFVLPKPDFIAKLSNLDVTNYLTEKVPGFMIPTIRVVESFPLLANGRLDRHQLLKDYLEGRESGTEIAQLLPVLFIVPLWLHSFNPKCNCAGFDDWGKLKIKNRDAVEAGKVLLEALYKLCSIPVKLSVKSLHLSFYALGGTSCNTVCLVLYLNKKGFPICKKSNWKSRNHSSEESEQ